MKEPIDHFAHVYDLGQKIEVEGNILMLIARFMAEVVQKETAVFASFTYPDKLVEVKDDNGKVIRVDYELKEHTKDSFMLTAANDTGAQLGLTDVGVKASQILSALLYTHEKNIEAGLAKKQEQVDEQSAFKS